MDGTVGVVDTAVGVGEEVEISTGSAVGVTVSTGATPVVHAANNEHKSNPRMICRTMVFPPMTFVLYLLNI
jgi:hypothetical protein